MKKVTKNLIASSVVVIGVLGMASAMADTATVGVSATVSGNCRFNSNGTVSFTLDPTSTSAATGIVTQPTFWCTKNSTYAITDDKGLHESGTIYQMQHATTPTELIPYTFTYTASGMGAGPGAPITLNIASTVNNTDYVNKAAGNYSDTVTLTITP
jgi:spore coat protein U-like protein